MTNKEFQELIDEQPVYTLSAVQVTISNILQEKWELEDRIDKAIEYITNNMAHMKSNGKLTRQHLLNILQGSDKE